MKAPSKVDPNNNAYISFQCGMLKTHRRKTSTRQKLCIFQDLPIVGLEQEDRNVQKDFGYDLVEQVHGGTSLSFSSMRISFNYVTSIIPFSVFDRFSVDS